MLNKKVIIIVLSKNSRHLLPDCLSGIERQSYPKKFYKTIVVDEKSIDSSVGYVKDNFPEIKVIVNNAKLGDCAAFNQGYFFAQKYNSEYLVLLRAEVSLNSFWLGDMISLLEKKKKAGIAGSKILDKKNKTLQSLGGTVNVAGISYPNRITKSQTPFKVDYAPIGACVIKMSAIKKTGLFDEKFFDLGDVDLGWRMRLAGYEILIDPNSVAHCHLNEGKDKAKYFHLEKNRIMMLLQNYRIITLILLLPLTIFIEFCMFIDSFAHGYFWQKKKSYLWIISRLVFILGRRINVQFNTRKIGDLQIIRVKS